MFIKSFEVGQLGTNCYIVADETTLECVIIDPGDEAQTILDYIEEKQFLPRAIMLTHGHFDHWQGLPGLLEELDIPTYMNKKDLKVTEQTPGRLVFPKERISDYSEGIEISIGSLVFKVLDTPGHSKGSVTLLCENAMFSGDTLFRGCCGRTDFDGGDIDEMLASLARLGKLEYDYEIYPGHMATSTLSTERAINSYMKYALRDRK